MENTIDNEIQVLQEKIKSLKKKKAEAERIKLEKISKFLIKTMQDNSNFCEDILKLCDKHNAKEISEKLKGYIIKQEKNENTQKDQ